MQCHEFERQLQFWLDDCAQCGQVAADLPTALAEHGRSCRGCSALVADYRTLFAALGQMKQVEFPSATAAGVAQRALVIPASRDALAAQVATPLQRQQADRSPAFGITIAALVLVACSWWFTPSPHPTSSPLAVSDQGSPSDLPPNDAALVAAISQAWRSNRGETLVANTTGGLSNLTLVSATMSAASQWLQARPSPWERVLQSAGKVARRTDGLVASQGSSVLASPEPTADDFADYGLSLLEWEQPSLGTVLNLAGWRSMALPTEMLDGNLFEQPQWLLQVADGISPMANTMAGTITALLRALPADEESPTTDDRGARSVPLDIRYDRAICLG
jgi:hypothetical protein